MAQNPKPAGSFSCGASSIGGKSSAPSMHIHQASSPDELVTISKLFVAYTESLGIDLTFQSFADELASLPGAYASPSGALLLATDAAGVVLGCMGVRKLPYKNPDGNVCEAKRLYVTPEGRGRGIGRALIDAGIAAARNAGYVEMKLDTLANMKAAQGLYQGLGFVVTDAYYDNPIAGTVYMSLKL